MLKKKSRVLSVYLWKQNRCLFFVCGVREGISDEEGGRERGGLERCHCVPNFVQIVPELHCAGVGT